MLIEWPVLPHTCAANRVAISRRKDHVDATDERRSSMTVEDAETRREASTIGRDIGLQGTITAAVRGGHASIGAWPR